MSRSLEEINARIASKIRTVSDEEIAEASRRREALAKRLAEDQRRLNWQRLVAQVGKRYAGCRLETFEVYDDQQRPILDAVRDFLAGPLDAGLLLYGPRGTGKDHLLIACLHHATIHRGMDCLWVNGLDLFGANRDRITHDEEEARFIRRFTGADVLAISDPIPPSGAVSDPQSQLLFRIIDRRYRDLKPTWVTLNVAHETEASERMGAQIVDRIRHDALCLKCAWPSHRRRK